MMVPATIRPLVIPTRPAPDESLAGLIARATEANVLGGSRIILNEVGLSLSRPGSVGRDLGDLGPRLAEKMGCACDDVAYRAHPYVGEAGRSAPMHWGGTQLLRSDLHLNRRRISPETLLRQDHHPASWMLSLLAYCPSSFERLIDRCTACGEALGWVAARGVGICEHCRTRVEHPDRETLPDSLRDGYAAFAALLSINPAARNAATDILAPELQALATSDLAGLAISIGRALVPGAAEVRRDRFDVAPPLLTANIVSVGASMLSDWPHGFRSSLAEDYAAGDDVEQAVIRMLQQRCRDRGMEPDAARVMKDALPELFTFGRKSLGSLAVPMMDPTEFRRRTGFSNIQWQTLHPSGALGRAKPTGWLRTSVRVPRAEAERLIALKDASQPGAALEQLLGLPTYAIEQLACAGEIEHADHPGFRVIGIENRVTSDSAAALVADLQRPGVDAAPPRGAIPLLRLAAMFCGGEKPWGAILTDLRKGQLRHWVLPETEEGAVWRRPLIRRILVMPDHFGQSPPSRFDHSRYPVFPFEPTLSQQDAIEVLGTTAPQLKHAIAEGQLEFARRSGKAIVTDRRHVGELARIHASPAELGLLLGLSRNHMVVRHMEVEHPSLKRQPLGWLRNDLARERPDLFSTIGC